MIKLPVVEALTLHQAALRACQRCPTMIGPVIAPPPVDSRVMIFGQAPGPREADFGRPFAWTAGKQLFKWFKALGLNEDQVRSRAYIAAVCRCFPGKTEQKQDRVPDEREVANCASWLRREVELLRPELVIPVGKLAIAQILPDVDKLDDVIGTQLRVPMFGQMVDAVPLPHPSGASTWFRTEPGATLTRKALARIHVHPAWRAILAG